MIEASLRNFQILKSTMQNGGTGEIQKQVEIWKGLEAFDDDNCTLVHYMARYGTPEGMKYLIDSGANINIKKITGS